LNSISQHSPDQQRQASADINRIYAYVAASFGGLVGGLARSSPNLSDSAYSEYALWAVCALIGALFFSVISTKDYRSRVGRLFGCGVTALVLFFIGVALQAFFGSELPAPAEWPFAGANAYLIPVAIVVLGFLSGIGIRRAERAGFPSWLEVPSFAAVTTFAIIVFFLLREKLY